MITIYTTGPQCIKCTMTKRAFADKHVQFTEVRLDETPETAAAFREAGHKVAPVVHDSLTDSTWSDFRRDMIKASIEARR